jgi:hypothetical protein
MLHDSGLLIHLKASSLPDELTATKIISVETVNYSEAEVLTHQRSIRRQSYSWRDQKAKEVPGRSSHEARRSLVSRSTD